MLEAFAAHDLNGRRVVWPRGNLAPDALAEGLRAFGATVDAPVVYETKPVPENAKECASAIASADRAIRLGEASFVVAGGMESMSNAPYVAPNARWGGRIGAAGPRCCGKSWRPDPRPPTP